MKQNSYGGILVILLISLCALGCGAFCGSYHIGEEFSKQVLPSSMVTPVDVIGVIDEKGFEAANITIELYIPKPVTKTKTVTNTTNSSNVTINITNSTKYDSTNTSSNSN
ncbi:MAG TPA: hypothetical protein HA355_01090 [Methanosphaera sp.]|nr:hypothetical protein [Methanosphaera sp.]